MPLLSLKPLRIGWPPMRLGAGPAPDPVTPDMIPSVRAVEVTADSMLVEWDTPYDGGSPITRYILQYREDRAGVSFTSINPATSPQLITGLTPDTDYVFRARADNALGNGPVAPVTVFRTLAEAPPSVPDMVILQAMGQSLALGPIMGAQFAPNGQRWRDTLGSPSVRMLTGLRRADGVAVTQVATPLMAGYDLTAGATGEAQAAVTGNIPSGFITALALVRDGLIPDLVAFQFHDAGGLSVEDLDADPATGTPGRTTLYDNAEHWQTEAARIYGD